MPVKKQMKKALKKMKKSVKPKPSNFKDVGRIGQPKTRTKQLKKPSKNKILPVLDMKNPTPVKVGKVVKGKYSVRPIYA